MRIEFTIVVCLTNFLYENYLTTVWFEKNNCPINFIIEIIILFK